MAQALNEQDEEVLTGGDERSDALDVPVSDDVTRARSFRSAKRRSFSDPTLASASADLESTASGEVKQPITQADQNAKLIDGAVVNAQQDVERGVIDERFTHQIKLAPSLEYLANLFTYRLNPTVRKIADSDEGYGELAHIGSLIREIASVKPVGSYTALERSTVGIQWRLLQRELDRLSRKGLLGLAEEADLRDKIRDLFDSKYQKAISADNESRRLEPVETMAGALGFSEEAVDEPVISEQGLTSSGMQTSTDREDFAGGVADTQSSEIRLPENDEMYSSLQNVAPEDVLLDRLARTGAAQTVGTGRVQEIMSHPDVMNARSPLERQQRIAFALAQSRQQQGIPAPRSDTDTGFPSDEAGKSYTNWDWAQAQDLAALSPQTSFPAESGGSDYEESLAPRGSVAAIPASSSGGGSSGRQVINRSNRYIPDDEEAMNSDLFPSDADSPTVADRRRGIVPDTAAEIGAMQGMRGGGITAEAREFSRTPEIIEAGTPENVLGENRGLLDTRPNAYADEDDLDQPLAGSRVEGESMMEPSQEQELEPAIAMAAAAGPVALDQAIGAQSREERLSAISGRLGKNLELGDDLKQTEWGRQMRSMRTKSLRSQRMMREAQAAVKAGEVAKAAQQFRNILYIIAGGESLTLVGIILAILQLNIQLILMMFLQEPWKSYVKMNLAMILITLTVDFIIGILLIGIFVILVVLADPFSYFCQISLSSDGSFSSLMGLFIKIVTTPVCTVKGWISY